MVLATAGQVSRRTVSMPFASNPGLVCVQAAALNNTIASLGISAGTQCISTSYGETVGPAQVDPD